jgi:hypothetical protein
MYFSGQADLVPQELCFFTFYLILLRVMKKKKTDNFGHLC